ncbi:MucBP domain-containing protein [Levilactobacillus angrenensis]|uniref:MucBP domain-containing protein n=1 Tax=Levilactobacillus angrenensis TaxID=2486020 RepID=A0ABW1UAJ7_9LACO|nr:MucBP domain-containing protein [Levilactobacillus angrenensis]
MFNSVESKRHYKMYKKGKHWLFAGILTVALASGGGVVATADTTDSDQAAPAAENAQEAPTNQPDVVNDPEVQLTKPEQPAEAPAVADEEPVDNTAEGTPSEEAAPEEAASEDKVADAKEPTTPAPELEIEPESATPAKPAAASPKRLAKYQAPAPQKPAAPAAVTADTPVTPVVDNFIDEWLPNQTLQNEVLRQLQGLSTQAANDRHWDSVADITQDDMALLTNLSVSGGGSFPDTYIDGKKSFSLKGLEYAVNLTKIHFSASQNTSTMVFGDITDISPLAGLKKLEDVDLSGNRISDLTPLAGLTNIKDLDLTYNQITDFSVLAGRKFDQLSTKWQYIILPKIRVNSRTRTADISQLYVNSDGQVVTWSSGNSFTMPYQVVDNGHSVQKLFYRGMNGAPKKNTDGSLTFTGIYDQEPGPTTTSSNYTVDPQDDKYFLIGQLSENNGRIVLAAIFQPYEIADEAATVTAHYQDEAGKTLREDEVLPMGLVGDSYQTQAKEIAGYTLTALPENAEGLYGTEPIEVYYVYQKTATVEPPVVTPAAEIKVTVHYQLADGTAVADDTTFTGKTGEAYSTTPLDLSGQGLKLVGTPANANGTLGNADVTVVYVYANADTDTDEVDTGTMPDKVTPDVPDATDNDELKKAGLGAQITAERSQQRKQADAIAQPTQVRAKTATRQEARPTPTQAVLPQTNENQSTAKMGWIILGTLLGGLGLGLLRKPH